MSFRGFHFIRVDGFDVNFAQLAPFLFAPEKKLSEPSIVLFAVVVVGITIVVAVVVVVVAKGGGVIE